MNPINNILLNNMNPVIKGSLKNFTLEKHPSAIMQVTEFKPELTDENNDNIDYDNYKDNLNASAVNINDNSIIEDNREKDVTSDRLIVINDSDLTSNNITEGLDIENSLEASRMGSLGYLPPYIDKHKSNSKNNFSSISLVDFNSASVDNEFNSNFKSYKLTPMNTKPNLDTYDEYESAMVKLVKCTQSTNNLLYTTPNVINTESDISCSKNNISNFSSMNKSHSFHTKSSSDIEL